MRKIKAIPDWLKLIPSLLLFHFHTEAKDHGIKMQPTDNFVVIKNDTQNEEFICTRKKCKKHCVYPLSWLYGHFGNPKQHKVSMNILKIF